MSLSGFAAIADYAVAPVAFKSAASAGGGPREAPAGEADAHRVAPAAGEPVGDLRLAQLMCARICHDLIGAAGAIESGIELLDEDRGEDPGDVADIHDLIGLSGRQLNRRLAFYRLAFGFTGTGGAGAGQEGSLADARRVTAGLIENSRVALRWNAKDGSSACDDARCPAAVLRLLLCAVLIAGDALFRGGELGVTIVGGRRSRQFAIDAAGRGARVAKPIIDALAADARLDEVTARTVHAYYLGRLIRRLGARLDITQTTDGFRLSITVPADA